MCFRKPSVIAYAAVVGKAENEGPYGGEFDEVVEDNKAGSDTWEQAESLFQQRAVGHVLRKSGLEPDRIDLMIAGDLLNQCVGSSYGLKDYFIPYLGIYGACSTFAEGLLLSAALVNAGYIDTAIASTSSHFSTAERQFRFPLNYGGVRTPTAQWTATASGCTILSDEGPGPYITHVTCGKIVDKGIRDANNMGAAMAPAAYDTLSAFFRDTGTTPQDYDAIFTGDLGELGHAIVRDFFRRDGMELDERYQDCGMLLYDRKQQDMHAGASGCGCSASVLNGYLLTQMRQGRWQRIVFAPTGALLSPVSTCQGESIPSICHAVCLSAQR